MHTSIRLVSVAGALCLVLALSMPGGAAPLRAASVLADNLLVTWYGNPHSTRMGILGERKGAALAAGLREQAAAYEKATTRKVLMAYHLVTVVAQAAAGSDGLYRRREFTTVIRSMLNDARASGFKLILDVQPGLSTVAEEVNALRPFLIEPDVYLALDPEFAMSDGKLPGRVIGTMRASDVNAALDILEEVIAQHQLPPKVLIVHQFTWNMLPDKQNIRTSPTVDVVLDMDGFGAQHLKLSTYRSILRQTPLAATGFKFTGFKLFYKQDTNLFSPEQVMSLNPPPAVVIYQ